MNESGGKRRGFWRIAAWVLLPLLVLILVPYLVAPLYRMIDPVSTLMVWRWVSGSPVERRFVPIGQMASVLPFTVIGSEDGQFCRHHGVDWRGLREALQETDDWGELRGGSTITQQVAKNLFLWQGRSVIRKALELPLAIWIDLVLPKRRILEIYLNIAEWGPSGQFGAEAGARFAFDQSARELDARQAALMAAVLPNPHVRSARRPGAAVRRLAGTYQRRGRFFARTATCLGLTS